MLPLSAQLKDFWFRKLANLQDQKFISKTVAKVDNLCMVDRVKFVMHFKDFIACCKLQHNHWGGWWMGSFAKYWGPGPQDWCTPYVTTEHRHVRQDHCSLLQCYYLSVNVRCLRDSLSVTDSGSHSGTPFKALVDFLCDKIYTEFSPATSQRKWHAQNFGRISFGGPFPAGGPTHVHTVPNG